MLHRVLIFILPIVALFAPLVARADVHDGANIFSSDAIEKANSEIDRLKQKHNKDFVIETFAKVPDDEQDQLKNLSKDDFFKQWMVARARALRVNGVYTLISMDPKYVEVGADTMTRSRGDFTDADLGRLRQQWRSALHQQQYDQGLLQAVDSVDRTYTANINSGQAGPQGQNYPGYPTYPSPGNGTGQSFGFGSLICLGVGALLLFSLIRRSFGGGGFGGYGQGYGGYGYGGGGGGFGGGLLGGLLGGVIGGEADRWMRGGGQSGGYSGGSSSFPSGGGGSFDSGPTSPGEGFGGGASGGDFGSSGGGGGGDSGGSF